MDNSANVTLDQVTIENGNSPGAGGILDEGGTLSIIDSTVANNIAGLAGVSPGLGGGIDMDGGIIRFRIRRSPATRTWLRWARAEAVVRSWTTTRR